MPSWYRRVDIRMEGDAKYRALSGPQPNGKSLWERLLYGSHTLSLPGLSVAGEAQLAEGLGWSLKGFREAFRELSSKGMAKADWQARVVWVPNAIKYNPPDNPNVVKSWGKLFDMIPECDLKAEAHESLKAFIVAMGEGFAKGFREGFGERYAKSPSPSPSPTSTPSPSGSSSDAGRVPCASDDARRLADLLASLIRGRLPRARIPASLDRWAVEIDKLHRIERREWAEIERVLAWSQSDPFWQSNILSGPTLRKQFDKLDAQSRRTDQAPRLTGRALAQQKAVERMRRLEAEAAAAERTAT